MEKKMKTVWLCQYCIQGMCSHGEKIYSGNVVEERECYLCEETDDCYECLMEE